MGLELKGITVPALLIKLDKEKSFEENLKELEEKLSSAFFENSYAVIDYQDLNLTKEQIDKLEDILKKYNSKILGYKFHKTEKDNNRKEINKIIEKKALKIVNRTVRSGQRIEHDGDILILGDVNPDAYIIASGNVIVMGKLRGIVHAGANGDETAIVLALKLMPQQLRIASFFSRSPDVIEEPEYPEKAYIEDNQIYIEKI